MTSTCKLFQIPSDPHSSDPGPFDNQDIESLCLSPAEQTLAISTDKGQLYSISLSAVDMKQVRNTSVHSCGDQASQRVDLNSVHLDW